MSEISRSVYQKLKEENKRLLADIKALTNPIVDMDVVAPILKKWRKHFSDKRDLNQTLHELAKWYIKKHPEYDIKNRNDILK